MRSSLRRPRHRPGFAPHRVADQAAGILGDQFRIDTRWDDVGVWWTDGPSLDEATDLLHIRRFTDRSRGADLYGTVVSVAGSTVLLLRRFSASAALLLLRHPGLTGAQLLHTHSVLSAGLDPDPAEEVALTLLADDAPNLDDAPAGKILRDYTVLITAFGGVGALMDSAHAAVS